MRFLCLVSLSLLLVGTTQAAAAEEELRAPNWIFQQELHAFDSVPDDAFGQAVAIENGTIVVGASRHYIPTESGIELESGSAYVFTSHVTDEGNMVWSEAQRLVVGDPGDGDWFGSAVDISHDTIVVGAPFADHSGAFGNGAVYVFSPIERNNASETWAETQKLFISGSKTNDHFGASVAVHNDKIVVGETARKGEKGAAYVFKRNTSGEEWVSDARLTATIGYRDDEFGKSVDVSGDMVVVGAPKGAPLYAFGNRDSTGYAVVFQKTENESWDEGFLLVPSEGIDQEKFGDSVAIEGNTIVVGSGKITGGVTYVFEREDGSNNTWVETQRLAISGTVDIDGNQMLVKDAILRRLPRDTGTFVKVDELEGVRPVDAALCGDNIVVGNYEHDAFLFVDIS